ncbi:hypothetical protein [Leptospira levettii]|uniref:Uncharacterized protein n=1 Tax=Leptospira levettii TaxID=2023178 RepID=A0AAW5VDY0_9LEPT|nr:hypothetical protein [Leptospira levettii]MCW7467679.1 hypothetical protein [Leptospira levettii]MCW7513359.1 hypothetical protein [Leptospira levettii]MCW7517082.1 hypothetical protein [Leptospira levettii]
MAITQKKLISFSDPQNSNRNSLEMKEEIKRFLKNPTPLNYNIDFNGDKAIKLINHYYFLGRITTIFGYLKLYDAKKQDWNIYNQIQDIDEGWTISEYPDNYHDIDEIINYGWVIAPE